MKQKKLYHHGIKIGRKVSNMPSVGILSLGCKVNTYESEYIRNILDVFGKVCYTYSDV